MPIKSKEQKRLKKKKILELKGSNKPPVTTDPNVFMWERVKEELLITKKKTRDKKKTGKKKKSILPLPVSKPSATTIEYEDHERGFDVLHQ